MASPPVSRLMCLMVLIISVLGLLSVRFAAANPEAGSVIPAESRPCVDCHAFEFMQRALQDLKKTAYNLDARAHAPFYVSGGNAFLTCLQDIIQNTI